MPIYEEKDKNRITKDGRKYYFKTYQITYAVDNYSFDTKVSSKVIKETDNEVRNIKRVAEWNFRTYEEFNQFISVVDNRTDYIMFNFLYRST